MSKIFTIKIAPVIKPFMRAKMTRHNAVCKYRDGSTYKYSPYRYGKPQCGRVYSYHDTDETVAERQPHIDRFVEVVEKVHAKARNRYFAFYSDYNQDDEIIRVYAPYPTIAPNATKTVYSQRKHQHDAHVAFLDGIKSKMRIQYSNMLCALQRGDYQIANDSLYRLNKYMFDLQSMCRPDHHEVVFKGKNNPLLANRK